MPDNFDLSSHGIIVKEIVRNASPSRLYELALSHEKGTAITDTGAMVAMSGEKTGRSPRDKRIVDEPGSTDDI